MYDLKSLNPLAMFNLLCLMICVFIHIYSFFSYLPFSFGILISLVLSLFLNAFWIFLKQKNSKNPPWSFSSWSTPFQSVFIILFIYALLQFLIFYQLVGNFRVEKVDESYHLFERDRFVAEVSQLEYQTYWARSARLFSSYLILFFSFIVYSVIKQLKR